MKVKVTTYAEHSATGERYQETFENIGGLSLTPSDGELVLTDHRDGVLHVFESDEWSAVTVEKED